MSTGSNTTPESYATTDTIQGASCGSSSRGALIVTNISSDAADALCYCAYNSDGTKYEWYCFTP